MRKFLFALMLSVILFEFFIIDICNSSEIDIIYVNNDYDKSTEGWGINCFSKIQEAINASYNGYTIIVYNGTYFEHININKSIKIIGENDKTTIDGQNIGNIVSIISDDVTFQNFTIKNSGKNLNNSGMQIFSNNNIITNNLIINSSIGIYLKQCSNNLVKQNNFNNNNYGIGIDYCDNKNEIDNNTIYNSSTTGIYVAHSINNEVYKNYITKSSYGIALSFSDKNKIMYNMINDIFVDGIYLYFCDYGHILNNYIKDGECGIKVISSNKNIIKNNIISNFSIYGINLFHSGSNDVNKNIISNGDTGIFVASDSIDNVINNNMFSSNNQKIYEEPHIQKPSNIPGFEFVIIIICILFIVSRKIYR